MGLFADVEREAWVRLRLSARYRDRPGPILIKWIVDEALEGGDSQVILGASLLSAGLILLHYSLAVYGTMRIAARLQEVIADFRSYIFNRIQYISFGYLDTAATGKLVSKYSFDTQRVHDTLLIIAVQVVPNMLYSVGVLIVLLFMNWQLCLVTVLLLPVFYIARKGYVDSYKTRNNEARVAQENLTGKAGELINSVRMVRSLGQDEAARNEIRWDNDEAALKRFRVITISSHFGTFIFVATQTVTLIILGLRRMARAAGASHGGHACCICRCDASDPHAGQYRESVDGADHRGNESYRSIRELVDTPLVERWTGTKRPDQIKGEIELRYRFQLPE